MMGLFDKPKNQAPPVVAPTQSSNKSVQITFSTVPDNYEDFAALPQAAMQNPFDTAALTVVALCVFAEDKDTAIKMLNLLKGPRPVSTYDIQFITDRLRGKDYVPRSYFNGTSPQNDYAPSTPYSITVSENRYSYQEHGYAKLYLNSSGADSPRSVTLRLAKDGRWYLWEQFLLPDIRPPESTNPWA